MPDFDYKEKRFEQDIEEYLTTKGGYTKGNPKAFDRKLALDVNTFISFIKTSRTAKSKGAARSVFFKACKDEKQLCLPTRVADSFI